ncbi:MAG: nucleotidyltransferase family protein [Candidatus Kariarchaeaceae archaeon]|jgi:molybdenum cofactor cytidylyltransferase
MKSDWIAVIILAAGQSTRFGKNKLLTVFKDKKLIEHTLEPYINNQEVFKKVIVVLGSLKDDFQLLLKNSQVITTYNRDYQSSGMSSSIKVGISKLLDSKLNNCKGVIIHPADIPFVREEEISKILESAVQENTILIPSYKNQRGHPLFFSKDLIKELSKLSDKEKGLRGYLRGKKDIIRYIEVNSNRVLFDVDIVEDLEKIENIFFS